MFHLLEELKVVQDRDDGLFLSAELDKIISEFEKLKDLDSTIGEVYKTYKKEGIFDESTI